MLNMTAQIRTTVINTTLKMEFDNFSFVMHLILIGDGNSLFLHKLATSVPSMGKKPA